MQEIRKGFYLSEERLEAIRRNRYGIEKTLYQQLKSLFTRKTKEIPNPKE